MSFTDLKTSQFNVFVDKFEQLYSYILEMQPIMDKQDTSFKIAVVLNYCSYDLFATLCFMELLLSKLFDEKYRCSIQFYTQTNSMFFHATPDDVAWLRAYYSEETHVQNVFKMFETRLNEKEWAFSKRLPFYYPEEDMKLFSDYDLCIFKGDYNYRKLVKGMHCDYETSLREVIPKNVPFNALCTMRVIKSDIIFDLKEDEQHSMNEMRKDFKLKNANCLDLNFIDLRENNGQHEKSS